MPYATVSEVEEYIDDDAWSSAEATATGPDPDVSTVEAWIDRASRRVDNALRPSVTVPLDETDDPDGYAEAKEIVCLLVAGRMIQRFKYHQAGDENVASDWIREAERRMKELGAGIVETDAGTSRTNIRSKEVDIDDAANELIGMTDTLY